MLAESCQVFGSSVAFMLREAVLRVELVVFLHSAVALRFRENGSRGDRCRAHIAMNQRLLFDRQVEFDGVEQEVIRKRVKLRDGGNHRLPAGLIDVPGVNPAGVDFSYRPCQRMDANSFGQNEASLGIYFLGVVEANDPARGTQNDGCCHYWAE